jgi:putative membrane protein
VDTTGNVKQPGIKTFLQGWAINTLAVLVACNIIHGIHYEKPIDLLVASLLLGILNAFVRPILMLLALPLLLLTLGLFTLVINAGLLMLVGQILPNFQVDTFWDAVLGAIVIGIISVALNSLTGTGKTRVRVERRRTPPPGPGGGGPVIDV